MTTINTLELARYLQELKTESSRVVNYTLNEAGEIVLPRNSSGCCALPDLEFLLLTIIASSLSKLDLSVSLEALAEALAQLGDINFDGLSVDVNLQPLIEVLTELEVNRTPNTNNFQILCSANDPTVKYLVFAAPLTDENGDLQFFYSINGGGNIIPGFPDDAIMCYQNTPDISLTDWQSNCYYTTDDNDEKIYYTQLIGIVEDTILPPIWLNVGGDVVPEPDLSTVTPCGYQQPLIPPSSEKNYLEVCVETPIDEFTNIYKQVFVDTSDLTELKYFIIEESKFIEYTPAVNSRIIIGSCPVDARNQIFSCELIEERTIEKEEYFGDDSGVSKCGDPFTVEDFYGIPQHIYRGIATKTPLTDLIVSPTNKSYSCYFSGYITLPLDLPDDISTVRITPVGNFDEGGTRLMVGRGLINIVDEDNSLGQQSLYLPIINGTEQTFRFVWQLWYEIFLHEARLQWDIGNGLEDIPLSVISNSPERYQTKKYILDESGVLIAEDGTQTQIGISGYIDVDRFINEENIKYVTLDDYSGGELATPQTSLIEGVMSHKWEIGYPDEPIVYELTAVILKDELSDENNLIIFEINDSIVHSENLTSDSTSLELGFVKFEAELKPNDILTIKMIHGGQEYYFSHLDFKVSNHFALNELVSSCPKVVVYELG